MKTAGETALTKLAALVKTALSGKAPNAHAVSATTYGKGTASLYGHVKLSDSTTAATAAASGGTAATPKAVSAALTAAKSYADSVAGTPSKAALLDMVYPVGSIYMSSASTPPATLFGGTWERLQDRFLLAGGTTYTPGTVGGEAEHKLTEAEMPSHEHAGLNYAGQSRPEARIGLNSGTTSYRLSWESGAGSGVNEIYTHAAGGGAAHNNMPPYWAVYMWERTA